MMPPPRGCATSSCVPTAELQGRRLGTAVGAGAAALSFPSLSSSDWALATPLPFGARNVGPPIASARLNATAKALAISHRCEERARSMNLSLFSPPCVPVSGERPRDDRSELLSGDLMVSAAGVVPSAAARSFRTFRAGIAANVQGYGSARVCDKPLDAYHAVSAISRWRTTLSSGIPSCL